MSKQTEPASQGPSKNDLKKAKAKAQATAKEANKISNGPADNNINIARAVMAQLGDLVYLPEMKTFYVYKDIIWKPIHQDYVLKACLDCTDMVRPGKNNESKAETVLKRIKTQMAQIEYGRKMNDREDTMTIKNGKFCIETLKLSPHDRNDYSTQLIDAELTEADIWLMGRDNMMDLDPEKRFPRFWNYLLETFEGYVEPLKTIQYVQEIMGYCLVSHCKAQKAFFLVGNGEDGKSVLCQIMTHVVGEDNTIAIPFEGLCNRFDPAALKDKLANISADSNKIKYRDNKGTGRFKSIVSGDRIMVEFKGVDLVPMTPTATMVLSVNNMPESSDSSHGWQRRINIMPFHNRIPQNRIDRELADKIIREEGPALFLFAMQGLQRLKKRNWAFRPCQDCLDATNEYIKGNDPFTRFFNDHVILQKRGEETLSILKDHLFSKYNEWLDDYDMVAPRIDLHDRNSKSTYGKKLNVLMEGRYFKCDRPTIDGQRPYRYLGIACDYGNFENDEFDF